MRHILYILTITAVILVAIFTIGKVLAPKIATPINAPSATVTNLPVANPPNTMTIQLVQPPAQTKNAILEFLQIFGPYFAAFIALLGVLLGFGITLHKLQKEARYSYASEILKFRLRQIQEFYAPALLLIEQSRIVYEKLLWTIERDARLFLGRISVARPHIQLQERSEAQATHRAHFGNRGKAHQADF